MAYHPNGDDGASVHVGADGSLYIAKVGPYGQTISISSLIVEDLVIDALFEKTFYRLLAEMTAHHPPMADPLTARLIDAIAEMENASLPPYIQSGPLIDYRDGRVIDAIHLYGINELPGDKFTTRKQNQRAQEYLDNQKSLSMDERYMLACLSTSPLYCRASTILRYEHQQVRSLL